MQPVQPSAASASNVKPVVATLFGIPAAAIVLAAANGTSAPLVEDGAAALVALPAVFDADRVTSRP